ncbi:MAG: EAL domain-containing protein [Lachnospiraceae bacterium]|nr:EAL domain-containing protein [Lachnospiraceae bacterium]
MFVNKMNQLYKPKRVLFYRDIKHGEVEEILGGGGMPEFDKYKNTFGTYDAPGIFYIASKDEPVIGVEFRMDDPRINYPENMESIVLNESFFYSLEIDNEISFSKDTIKELMEKVTIDDDARRNFSYLVMKKTSNVIGVFPDNKIRILYEMELSEDMAQYVIKDEAAAFHKADLYHKAFFDPITDHYNWNHLVAFLEMPMNIGVSDYSFVHFDVKAFRVINEVYGHAAANKVLCNIVKVMNEADFVFASGRCHNDNFAMMIKDMPVEETVETLKKFFDKLSTLEEDPNYKILYRCGVVTMPISLLAGNRVADAAKMAQALGQDQNKTEIMIYTQKMHDDVLWSNYIKAYLDTAIKNDEFLVYLQPKIDSTNNKVKGAEALCRWNYKKQEMLSPYKFIPFFEKDGSIGKIDDIVLRKVCGALKKWKSEGKELYPVSVNLSRSRMYDRTIIDHFTKIVDSYGVAHELIDFELTESAYYDNTEQMINTLYALRNRGFKISMDDFGTGYSSLSLLTCMPIDTLKIDKSFVDKIGGSNEKEEDLVVLKHIISLAKDLGFSCLAEGAEYKEQVDRLSALGCNTIQGYYYSKPISIEEFDEKYLRER